ncbi:hypothetical protein RCS94_04070 [Orbaceae bacterium ac157xtp]
MFSFKSILDDTFNFIRNHFATILISLFILCVISQVITFFLSPDMTQMQEVEQLLQRYSRNGELSTEAMYVMLSNLPQSEVQRILAVCVNYVVKFFLMRVFIIFLLNGIMLSLIFNLSHNQLSLNNLIKHFVRISLKIILFIGLTILAFIGLIFALAISVLVAPILTQPLFFFAVCIYIVFYIIFMATIIEPQRLPGTGRNISAWELIAQQKKIIIPGIALWLIVGLCFNSVSALFTSNLIVELVFNMISLLLNFVVFVFIYRLFILTNRRKYDASN